MQLIVGLGNTGSKYAKNRHNLGFQMLDKYANQLELEFKDKTKFKAKIAEASGKEKTILAKPATKMNLSGHCLSAITDYFEIKPAEVLVVHDEIDLEFGKLRLQFDGGTAGHNGIKSVTAHIGEDFWRLRLGIANQHAPKQEATKFVLSDFNQEEAKQLPDIYQKAKPILDSFASGEELEATTLRIQ